MKMISTAKIRTTRQGDCSQALYQSIKTHGILEPLVLGPGNVLLDGARRLQAAKELGLAKVPVIQGKMECWFNKSDIARAIRQLLGRGMTLPDVAEISGRSVEWLKEHLK